MTRTKLLGTIGLIFGLMTLFAGGAAIFGGAGVQRMAGDAVGLVLWGNFALGFAYVGAGYALITGRGWARPVIARLTRPEPLRHG